LPGLLRILDVLPPSKRPRLVRGDIGFGTDAIMSALEERHQSYLFKLKLTKNVKRYIEKVFWDQDWEEAGQGWEGKKGQVRLSGWKAERQVVILRRPLKGEEMLIADEIQGVLGFIEADAPVKGYEYAVLVTDADYEVLAIAQLYRDRADAENGFDELKNQWGWGGFVTRDLARCQLTARAVALIYNWWSLFVRLAHPQSRLEAITSRPLLMAAVGIKTEHAGQTIVTLTGLHAHFKKAKEALDSASTRLKQVIKSTAEQLPLQPVWTRVCQYLAQTITRWHPPQIHPIFALNFDPTG